MDAYRSPFDDWHQAASVRSMPADAWLAGGAGALVAQLRGAHASSSSTRTRYPS